MKLEHTECEAHGCQYNVTAGKLAEAEREIERQRDSNKNLEFNNTELGKICEKHMRTIEWLKAENGELKWGLKTVQGLDGEKIDELGKKNDKLRKALEKIREHYTLNSFAGVVSQEALKEPEPDPS